MYSVFSALPLTSEDLAHLDCRAACDYVFQSLENRITIKPHYLKPIYSK